MIQCSRACRRVLAMVSMGVILATPACSDDDGVGDNRIDGSGTVVTETREVGDFDRVELAGQGVVTLGAGADGSIEIEADDNLLPAIQTTVSGGTLIIRTRAGTTIDPTREIHYALGCPELAGATISGAGAMDLGTCTTSGALDLRIAGAGDLGATDLAAGQVTVDIAGSGSALLAGATDALSVVIAGAGNVDAADLEAGTVEVTTTGTGDVTAWAVDQLDVTIRGTGTVRYTGDPAVTSDVSGVGTVERVAPR